MTIEQFLELRKAETIADLREITRISGVAARTAADREKKKAGGIGSTYLQGQAEAWADAFSLIDRHIAALTPPDK